MRIPLPTLLSLVGCGDISNSIFIEDEEFLSALPTKNGHTVDVGEDEDAAKGVTEEAPSLLAVSWSVCRGVNVVIFQLLGAVDTIRAYPPTSRTENGRTWGPYEWDGTLEVSAAMSRQGDRYTWGLTGEQDGQTPIEFTQGTHYSGKTVSEGDGVFHYDITAVGQWFDVDVVGSLEVDYDLREGRDLLVGVNDAAADGAVPTSYTYAYRAVEDDGDFQFRTKSDLDWDSSDALADVTVRTRWVKGSGGRADATVTGGGLGAEILYWSQCWADDLSLTYEHDSAGYTEELGAESACQYPERADIDRI